MNTSNGDLQQNLLSDRTLPIITMMIDPWIDNMVTNSGASTINLAMPRMTKVITENARRNSQALQTPGHVVRTGRYGTTPVNCNVTVSSPRITGQFWLEVLSFP